MDFSSDDMSLHRAMHHRTELPYCGLVRRALAIASLCLFGSGCDQQQGAGPASESDFLVWHGMEVRVPECFVTNQTERQLDLLSTSKCTDPPLPKGVPWMSVFRRMDADRPIPFDQWEPCGDYEQCEKYRSAAGEAQVALECYHAVEQSPKGDVIRNGCRSPEHGLAIRYICTPSFCDRLQTASEAAFASLGRQESQTSN